MAIALPPQKKRLASRGDINGGEFASGPASYDLAPPREGADRNEAFGGERTSAKSASIEGRAPDFLGIALRSSAVRGSLTHDYNSFD